MQKTHNFDITPYLADFLNLAKTRSFQKAAIVASISQPAFSRRIQQLENGLEVRLFDRSVQPVRLTEAGETLLTHALRLQSLIDQAKMETLDRASHLVTPLRFVTTHTLAISFFPEWWKLALSVPELSDARASLRGQRVETCIQDLAQGLADFALLHVLKGQEGQANNGLEWKSIGTDRLIAVAAPRLKNPHEKLLGYTPGVQLHSWQQSMINQAEQRPEQTIFESPAAEVLKSMALCAHGMAILPERLVSDDLASGYLQTVDAYNDASLEMSICLLKQPNLQHEQAQLLWESGIED